jgi:hypothetical protein
MRTALIVIAAAALLGFLAVAVIFPGIAGAEAKEAAAALVTGADSAKQQVAAAAEKSGNLGGSGNGVKLAPQMHPKAGELKWIIEPNGTVRGWNETNAIEIAILPLLQGGKVSWNCRGYPNAAMPANCGGR